MSKVKKFYSLKSFRKDKASAKKYGDMINKIISNHNRYRDLINKYFAV